VLQFCVSRISWRAHISSSFPSPIISVCFNYGNLKNFLNKIHFHLCSNKHMDSFNLNYKSVYFFFLYSHSKTSLTQNSAEISSCWEMMAQDQKQNRDLSLTKWILENRCCKCSCIWFKGQLKIWLRQFGLLFQGYRLQTT
jgi:hypothetical protein